MSKQNQEPLHFIFQLSKKLQKYIDLAEGARLCSVSIITANANEKKVLSIQAYYYPKHKQYFLTRALQKQNQRIIGEYSYVVKHITSELEFYQFLNGQEIDGKEKGGVKDYGKLPVVQSVHMIPEDIWKENLDIQEMLQPMQVLVPVGRFDGDISRGNKVISVYYHEKSKLFYVDKQLHITNLLKIRPVMYKIHTVSRSVKEMYYVNYSTLFKWPTTEVGNQASSQIALSLKEQSQLSQLGYQITGLRREQRWKILTTKCLPTLGLKSAAYTIAFFVRSRKKMKNGSTRYANSIREWEYDLAELKKHFYKHEFTWPETQ